MQSLTNEKINDNTGLTAEEAEARRLAQLRARLNSRELAEEFARMVVARVKPTFGIWKATRGCRCTK